MAGGIWSDDRSNGRTALRGCRLVLLTATSAEAGPLLAALQEPELVEVATKSVSVGWLCKEGDGAGRGGLRVAVAVGGCDKANTAQMLTALFHTMAAPPVLVMQVGIAGAFVGPDADGARPGDVVLATEEVYADTGSSSPQGWLSSVELGLPLACVEGDESGNRFLLDAALVQAAATAVQNRGGFKAAEPGDRAESGERAESRECAAPRPRGGDGVSAASGPRVYTGRCLTLSRATGLDAEATVLVERWGALAESMEGAAAAHMCVLYGVPFLEVRGISNLVTDRDRASWEIDRAIRAAGQAALAICGAFDVLPINSDVEATWIS
ncbi:MAG: hypothetical protein ACOX8V_03040 [Thermoleophilia bacterium]